ncbi:MAG: heme lyase CcmF/NrfE family subunit, partial [Bacillota bacterium]
MYSALIGQAMLWLALLASLGAAAFSAAGIVRARPAWLRLGRTLVLVAFSFATVASAVLVVALLSDNFAIEYVAERSARAMPSIYKLGAWWGGQEGSLLFWLWLLLGYAALLVTGRPDVEAPR